jgi:hypothetical protein
MIAIAREECRKDRNITGFGRQNCREVHVSGLRFVDKAETGIDVLRRPRRGSRALRRQASVFRWLLANPHFQDTYGSGHFGKSSMIFQTLF